MRNEYVYATKVTWSSKQTSNTELRVIAIVVDCSIISDFYTVTSFGREIVTISCILAAWILNIGATLQNHTGATLKYVGGQ